MINLGQENRPVAASTKLLGIFPIYRRSRINRLIEFCRHIANYRLSFGDLFDRAGLRNFAGAFRSPGKISERDLYSPVRSVNFQR
jgi:hypothetical protein